MIKEIVILLILIFFYVHIHFHLNTNNDLDIIKFDNELNKQELEKVCSLKQPTRFIYKNSHDAEKLINSVNETVNVRQMKSKSYVSLHLKGATVLMENDKTYYSDNNTSLVDFYTDKHEESFLAPSMSIIDDCDIIIGTKDTQFPVRKMYHYRNYFYLASGNIKITLYAPNNIFNSENVSEDLVMLEYTVTPEKNKNYKSKSIEMKAGEYLFVPSYWYVKIEFLEMSYIMTHKYQSIMSTLSFMPEYIKHYFKRENQIVKVE